MNTTTWILIILFVAVDVWIISYFVKRSLRKHSGQRLPKGNKHGRGKLPVPPIVKAGSPASELVGRLERAPTPIRTC